MFQLEPLVILLYPPKRLELGRNVFLHLHPLGHDQPRSRIVAPKRKQVRVDCK
jgi:hypothetical protein